NSGGPGSAADDFPRLVNPWAAVISVGAGNRDGDPAPETLAALDGYTGLRTDERGWISFATDGKRLWAETER
ncbi:MAG: MBL fold metallo-hydrolase, partial [Chloroflexi bacterium]|nr:MBL fold metallo-hydrolase [Chloroflexota bacterium]